MTTRPPSRPQGEVFVGRAIPAPQPSDKGEDVGVDLGWIWDNETGLIVGLEGANPHPEDTFKVSIAQGQLSTEFVLPPNSKDRVRFDFPLSQRVACREATVADHPWQQAHGWVPGFDSITIERQYGKPDRNSPAILSAAVTDFFGSATTTHNVPMPATVDPNDGLIVLFFIDTAEECTATGFSMRATSVNTDRSYVFAKVATGTEDGANVNFLTQAASFATAQVYRIDAGTWCEQVEGIMVASATGTGTGPNSPQIVLPWGSNDAVFLAYCAKVSGTVTAAPTNYTNLTRDSSNLTGSARRTLTAADEDPGAFTGATSAAWTAHTIVIPSNTVNLGAVPTLVGMGTFGEGTAGVSVGLPGGVITGDVLLLHIQGEGEDANADPANADWTLIGSNASATGGTAGDTRGTLYYTVYDSGDPPSLSIGDAGDHTLAFITAWRGCDTTTPIHQSQGTTDSSGDTSASATGVTTTVDNCRIVASFAFGDDCQLLTWANANLTDLTHVGNVFTTQGADGALSVVSGKLASQGASGTTTGTVSTSEEEANWVVALAPFVAPPSVSIPVFDHYYRQQRRRQ